MSQLHPDYSPEEAMARAKHSFGEYGGVNLSIEASTTFTVMSASTMPEIFAGKKGIDDHGDGCYLYGRHFNPTVFQLARELAAMEHTESAYCTSSGMAAITATILQLCNAGDHVVSSNTVYGGTFAFMCEYLPKKAGISTTFVDIEDLESVEKAIRPNTRLIYAEVLANPTLKVADVPKLAEIAHRHGLKLIIDNTFTPMIMTPALMGADIVIYSMTKFINGASDIIAGAICGPKKFIMELMDLHMGSLMLLGPTMDPRIAFEISMRLPHLGIRMKEHSRRSLEICKRLDELGVVVKYPGLKSHPQHELFTRMMNPEYGYGGIFTIDAGTTAQAFELMEYLQNRHNFGFMAVSLGYAETLMSCSGSSTSSEMSEEDKKKSGISPGLIRISLGYTGTLEMRWEQLRDALSELGMIKTK